MYEDKELILRPDWQRYYVWSNKEASLLVESLFLRLPIPLIYLAEEDDGTFSVVDGQQRLTALVEFVRNQRVDPLKASDVKLSGMEVLGDLNGKTFNKLSKKQQSFLKNRELSIVRLKSDSDPDLKLKVFRRLNSGSVKLKPQELRNAAFRGPYNDLLKQLARNEKFLKMLKPKDPKPDQRMLDVELVLRFSAWLNRGWTTLTDKNIGAFLDQEMEIGKGYKPKDLTRIQKQFKNAVDLSYQCFGDRAFRRYFPGNHDEPEGEWETRQANKALYDVVMFGFTRGKKSQYWDNLEAIRETLIDLMATDAKFQDAITSGTSDPRRVNYRFTTWTSRLDELMADKEPRTFTRELKEKLFAANPQCALCTQKIHDVDDAHVHHVKHYWRGGKTIPENAALAHRYCNLTEGGGDADTGGPASSQSTHQQAAG